MATIKQIDSRSIHHIQSGQVIVDLCSVVKELVENSIDAGATIVDVRFKNQGLDLIEVQDNGSGISSANYASVALKHHTSKLSSYSDIASLQTFGFRGEALASLCALSILTITTCLTEDVPKGSKLTFESSGKLKGTSVVAAQRGTTVSVEQLFHNLPVRRRELDRNIKREWHKVIALLNQYACIQTNVKFSVSQQPTKGKRILLFSTRGNPSTRDNIINIFGAKTMAALVSLDLKLEMKHSSTGPGVQTYTDSNLSSNEVRVIGHVSRPVQGDGRQTPDRQMFFVNGRPCALPQFAKTFNEVYRSYNYSQSPFIFANIQLDTGAYDVNVSPDKRSILLHDQNHLLDTLRVSLTNLFDAHEYTIPISRPLSGARQPPSDDEFPRKAASSRLPSEPAVESVESDSDQDDENVDSDSSIKKVMQRQIGAVLFNPRLTRGQASKNLISNWATPKFDTDTRRLELPSSRTSREEEARFESLQIDEATNDGVSCSRSYRSRETRSSKSEQVKSASSCKANEQRTDANTTVAELEITSGSPLKVSPVASPLRGSHIPLIQSVNLNNTASRNLVRPIESQKRTASEVHTISIGEDTRDFSVSPSKRPRCGRTETERNKPSPSFGRQLSRLFAVDQDDDHMSVPEMDASTPDLSEHDDTASCQPKIGNPNGSKDTHVSLPDTPDNGYQLDAQSCEHASQAPELSAHMKDCLERRAETSRHGSKARGSVEPRLQTFQTSLRRKDVTTQIVYRLHLNEDIVRLHMHYGIGHALVHAQATLDVLQVGDIDAADAESKLPLIIAKYDFTRMRVAGQFNLGFIIAVRPAKIKAAGVEATYDELFILDQHASDEKYNFERLQNTTTIQAQRLVHPKRLQLTALEEEIILENSIAIEANGFKVNADTTGRWPVGSRCELIALPLSRETTFSLEDLEELISLLGDKSSESTHIPRPSKVRKMLAMRACRSSVMIGKALTRSQMYNLVKHMGQMDKPWNCPHGRPTMRHLSRLQSWDDKSWNTDLHCDSVSAWQCYAGRD